MIVFPPLILNGRITTTVTRAKETQKMAEKLITEAKKETLAGNRAISSELYSNEVACKVVEEIAPAMKDRKGGYTRVLKVGRCRGDAADMAILELVMEPASSKKTEKNVEKPAETKKEEPAAEVEQTAEIEEVEEVSTEETDTESTSEEKDAE